MIQDNNLSGLIGSSGNCSEVCLSILFLISSTPPNGSISSLVKGLKSIAPMSCLYVSMLHLYSYFRPHLLENPYALRRFLNLF